LVRRAEADLKRLGYNNVKVLAGDGYQRWPDHAPFDAIIVTCAPDQIPQPLLGQLRDGGRMIIPVGPADNQQLYLLQKHGTEVEQQAMLPERFVPLKRAQ
jgi:protein-L-isoaspartate(D-aspartate) O-methyltransferase